jgi:hypothetical protein
MYVLIRVQTMVTRTEMTTDDDLEAVQEFCDQLNRDAPPNVAYVVEEVQKSTRPLPPLSGKQNATDR